MTWPQRNFEYGSINWLRREVSLYLYNQAEVATLDFDQTGVMDSCVNSGLKQFQYPPTPHQWSFLNPTGTITLASGVKAYELPDDFGGILGEFTIQSSSGSKPIPIIPEIQLRQLSGASAQSGDPLYAAVRPKAHGQSQATIHEVVFYPTPNATAVVEFRYNAVTPDIVTTGTAPIGDGFPPGGKQYAETILASCLAIAEERVNKTKGICHERWLERLAAAIELDKRSLVSTVDSTWPIENPSPGLGINKAYLNRIIGREMGFGANPGAWNHKQSNEVAYALETGLRKFYSPPVLPNEKNAWDWTFLTAWHTITTISGQSGYDLPADFSSLDGPLLHDPGSNTMYHPIEVIGEHQLRQRQQSSSSGRPKLCAISSKDPVPAGGASAEVLLWPEPDGTYPISFRYKINPLTLDNSVTLPQGGQEHAQTIIKACLSAVEEIKGSPGAHSKAFLEHLRTSISLDRKRTTPKTLGYNHDPSDVPMEPWRDHHHCTEYRIPYNGVYY